MCRDSVWRSGLHEKLWVVCLELLGVRSVIAEASKVSEELSEGEALGNVHVSACCWPFFLFAILVEIQNQHDMRFSGNYLSLRFLQLNLGQFRDAAGDFENSFLHFSREVATMAFHANSVSTAHTHTLSLSID